ncbi:GFA family protein [Rubrobacter indicoceani]|uniref:GFA family protein n=1 Tax=Rubrobacter indicoceani TaxID=2051957 RepID=UPI000E5AB03A|nr:GFA family protein [Rubrobacter indicoceani]
MNSKVRNSGGCLCGGVRYEVRGPLRPVVNCHCSQCRRTSGHFVAATAAKKRDLEIHEAGVLRWYKSSEKARRGFCAACGSSLFWEPFEEGWVAIMAGTLDGPTGLRTEADIFVADAGDYYRVADSSTGRNDGEHGLFLED